MHIQTLHDRPEFIGQVATLIHTEWPYEFEGISLQTWTEEFQTLEGADRTTFIAIEDSRLLGTACLDIEDLPQRPEISPWLASVYVMPEARSRGLGSRLVQAVEQEAWTRDVPRLHLHTTDRESFYAQHGWTTLEHLQAWNKNVALMYKDIPEHAPEYAREKTLGEQPHAR
jgi:N-acetylglutamate synthase-like GNAT family acetyltransferase